MSTFGSKNWILVFGILCYALSSSRAQEEEVAENLETCTTEACTRISNVLSRAIDSDVRPCQDFYSYACGKILKETEFPDGWDIVNTSNSVLELMKQTLLKSIKQKNPKDPDVVKKAKSFFASCNSEDEMANLGVVPLTILLKNLNLPLRPPYLGALDMKDGFGTLLGKMRQYFYITFPFQLTLNMDPTDKNKSRLELWIPKRDVNSKIPYKPPPKPAPQPESQTEPKNESKTSSEEKNTEEKKPITAKKVSRKVSKNRSLNSLATRALESSQTSAVKSKVVRRKGATSNANSKGKEGGGETTKKETKPPAKTRVPKKTAGEKSEKGEKDKTKTPVKKSAVPKKTQKKKPENEQKEEPEDAEETDEKKKGKKKETKKAEKQEDDDEDETNTQDKEGSDSESKESPATLAITDDENQPLIEYMIKVAKYLYRQTNVKLLETKNDSLRQKVAEAAKIIHEIEKITVKSSEETGENGKEMTIQELQDLTNSFDTKTDKKPVIDWSNFIGALLSYHPTILKQFAEEGRKIYIANVNFLKSMMKIFYESNPRALYCALWWTVVRGAILDLPAELRAFELDYRKQVKMHNPTREEYCLTITAKVYGYAPAYDIIVDEKTTKNLQTATDLLRLYNGPLTSMIQNSSILDPRTIMAANVRYDSGCYTFAVPNTVNNAKSINEAYRSVIFHEYNYFFSLFFQTYEMIRGELEMLDLSLSFGITSPLVTESDYHVQTNSQAIPLIYSQFPFMGNGLISITMGMLIKPFLQQSFHHFDVLASEYNLWGIKENWWAKKSLKNYYAQAECFINAYNKECFDEGCVDGKRTLHENVADHGALKAAIQAYKNFQKQTKEPRLVDFESFSHLRLLTLSYAVSMCQTQTPQKLSEILKTSKYPPPWARVNQVMKNLPEFSEIWGCDADDAMNPKDKCEMWGFIEESKRKFVKSD